MPGQDQEIPAAPQAEITEEAALAAGSDALSPGGAPFLGMSPELAAVTDRLVAEGNLSPDTTPVWVCPSFPRCECGRSGLHACMSPVKVLVPVTTAVKLVPPPTAIPLGATVCAYVVIDTETSGLPIYTEIVDGKKVTVPADDPRQPYIAQACMIFLDDDLNELERFDGYVRPDGWEMQSGATEKNGLTTDFLRQKGQPIAEILDVYEAAIRAGAKAVIAHNAQFDCKMMRGAFRRAGRDDLFEATYQFCTMREWAAHAGGKWPKLNELCDQLGVEHPPEKRHGAVADAEAVARCLPRMRDLGIVIDGRVHHSKHHPTAETA